MAGLTVQRRALGRTGIDVSVLGLGTVKFGRNRAVRYPAPFELPDRRTLRRLLARARALGINLLDTAPAYGTSEERLGELLAGQRGDWVICSKAGEVFGDDGSHHDFSPGAVRRSVERSLARLRTDYLDIVLLHADANERWILAESGAVDALEALQREGKVRAIGISHKTVAGARLALDRCDVIMATLNLAYRDELPVLAEAGARGVGVLVKKVFDSGHAALAPQRLRESLALALAAEGVSSVVVGTVSAEHLADDAAVAAELLRAGPEQRGAQP